MTDLMPETVVDLDALTDGEPAAAEAAGPDVLDAVDEQLRSSPGSGVSR